MEQILDSVKDQKPAITQALGGLHGSSAPEQVHVFAAVSVCGFV